MFLHLPVFLPLRVPFFHRVLCSLRLDLDYTCTLNRVTFISSMSGCWEQELQQCLEADLDFALGDFIAWHPEVAPPTIRRRHASLRNKLRNRLKKRVERGVQSSSMANLNTPQAQAAKGSTGVLRNTPQAQAVKGSTGGVRNTPQAQAAKGGRNRPQAQAAKGARNTPQAQAAKGARNTPQAQAAKVVSQKLTDGGPGRWRQNGRCPPKSAQFWAKNSHFSPKTALVRVQNSQTKAHGCYTPRAA